MHDTMRTAAVIANYGFGVWAYCATPVLVRGYYAVGKQTLPVLIGAAMCVANVVLNLLLIWPLAEAGLALSTSITAILQVIWLVLLVPKHVGPLPWRSLFRTIAVSLVATLLMMGAITWTWLVMVVANFGSMGTGLPESTSYRFWFVVIQMSIAGGVYLGAILLLPGRREHLRLLMGKAG